MRFGSKNAEIRKLSTADDYESKFYEDDLITAIRQPSMLDTFMSSEFPLVELAEQFFCFSMH